MDLNELYSRHQVSIARASDSVSATGRESYRICARGYAARIADVQWLAGVARPTVVVGA
ncbi:hypothetical protein K7957_06580 [Sphingomonas yunnanensis]|uniref:hypothetical protein n=1 Tax=Sphingomonas yunnanensis TaxID=310400 RepID=UPI001CA7423D|nr:hypothetical protein [Sphingomonas yunnanensis]MBY9062592.1 hypothetical protein [Sphingomonas yunnanensis]